MFFVIIRRLLQMPLFQILSYQVKVILHGLVVVLFTGEMLSIITSGEAFPLEGIHDINTLLGSIKVPGTFIGASDLLTVRRTLPTRHVRCR